MQREQNHAARLHRGKGTFASLQELVRQECDDLLAAADAEPLPRLARLYLSVREAVAHAVYIVKLSRSTGPVRPVDFIGSFARLEAHIEMLKAMDDTPRLLSGWPKDAGFTFGLTAGMSALETGWNFAESIRDAAIAARSLHRIASRGEPYLSDKAGTVCGKHISAWADLALKELREQTIPPDHVWPTMGEIHRDGQAIQYKLVDEYERAVQLVARQAKASKQRRRTRKRNPTVKQLEALMVVAESGQNVTEAARRLNKDPKTVRQHYKAGMRNAGKLASKMVGKPSVRSAPMDRRGQSVIATNDDGPAPPIDARAKVVRDRR